MWDFSPTSLVYRKLKTQTVENETLEPVHWIVVKRNEGSKQFTFNII